MSEQVVLNQFLLIDVSLIVTNIFSVFFRFRLFILLPCKLLHVCLRNKLLINTFIIIIIIYSD